MTLKIMFFNVDYFIYGVLMIVLANAGLFEYVIKVFRFSSYNFIFIHLTIFVHILDWNFELSMIIEECAHRSGDMILYMQLFEQYIVFFFQYFSL